MRYKRLELAALALAALGFAGCGSDDRGDNPASGYDFTQILDDYAHKVVVATYADLRDKSATLKQRAAEYVADPQNQTRLQAVCDAWVAARAPWEASEAFLFGPAAFMSLDPALDSWPVDRQQLDDVLASNLQLNQDAVDLLGPSVKGFHTIEYLIFRDGTARSAGDVNAREREYLASVSSILSADCEQLWSAWAVGYDGGSPYAGEFAQAGKPGSRYADQTAAVLSLIEGMIAIGDEVANGKIAEPVAARDQTLVESQFSYNSLTDFQNNIRSVQNAYHGGFHLGPDGVGLDSFVNARNPALAAALDAKIQIAITRIGQIPEPFDHHLDSSVEIQSAQDAITEVVTVLEVQLKPLLTE